MNRSAWIVAAGLLSLPLLSSPAFAQQSRSGEYVVVGSGGPNEGNVGHLTTFRLDRATGDLTQIDQKEIGGLVSYVSVNPRHPVLYATAERGGGMHWVRIDPASGMIAPGGHQTSNGNPVYTSVDATGTLMLGVNYGRGTTDAFPLDPATGAIAGEPTNYDTGQNSHSAVFHPKNSHVYVASIRDSMVAQYALSAGKLTLLDPPTIYQPGGPRHFTFHPNGRFAYAVAGPTDRVMMFRVGEDGRLSPMGSVGRLPGALSAEAAMHMGSDIHVAPSGRFAYSANRGTSNTLSIFAIGEDGRLTLRGHESTRGNTPRTFDIDPDGELILVGNQDSRTVAVFRVSPETGQLSHLHTEDVTVTPWFVGVVRVQAQ